MGLQSAGECPELRKGAITETAREGSGPEGSGISDEMLRGEGIMSDRLDRARALIDRCYTDVEKDILAIATFRRALFDAYVLQGGFTPDQAWTLLLAEVNSPKIIVGEGHG